jgi:hypothetical protein
MTIPQANSPQLLQRLVEQVARGVRSTRALQEALGTDPRTVQAAHQAAAWLGFVVDETPPRLTPLGLALAYARARADTYAQAVWTQPFIRELLAGSDRLPSESALSNAITLAEPGLSSASVAKRAAALRALIEPAIKRGRPRPDHRPAQLALPFNDRPSERLGPRVERSGGKDYNPDIYRYLLSSLLQHGELALGEVRGLLDEAGVPQAPIGGYIDLALSRGDARRADERLVVTSAAVRRRVLSESTTSVILSDPGWRAWLAASADTTRAGDIARDAMARRYKAWDQRLLGHTAVAGKIEEDLRGILLDRPLTAFPLATPAPGEPAAVEEPFLDAFGRPGLIAALPPALLDVSHGVELVNKQLRAARAMAADVGRPTAVARPKAIHGALVHPGEPLPRAIPDQRSLRLRAMMCAPYITVATAALLLHREAPERFAIRRVHGSWRGTTGREDQGDPLAIFDDVLERAGHFPSRIPHGGLSIDAFVRVLVGLGIAAEIGDVLVLDEALFVSFRSEPEEQEICERLSVVLDVVAAHATDVAARQR